MDSVFSGSETRGIPHGENRNYNRITIDHIRFSLKSGRRETRGEEEFLSRDERKGGIRVEA